MTPVAVDVCIVGGGLTGLAAACAFRQVGASVVVIERRTEPGDPNRGDWLPPRVVALLKQWGVDFERRAAIPIRSVSVELGSKVIANRKLETDPGLCLPYAQLESALRDAARAAGVDLRLGWQLQALASNPTQQRVAGLTALSGGEFAAFETKLVVGADGRASSVREALGLKLKAAEKGNELLACEAELGNVSANLPDSVFYSVGRSGGGFLAPLSTRRVRVVAVTGVGEADALARKPPADLAQDLPSRSPIPFGASIDPARLRSYEQTNLGHATNYAATGAVCLGDAVHPPPSPTAEGILMAMLDVEALVRLVGPAIKEGERAVDRALVKFETERWPENEKRLSRGRAALKWLGPLSAGKLLLLRTPLCRTLLSGLLSIT